MFKKKTLMWKQNIALFLFGQIISILGSSLVEYSIIWYIALKTESGLMLTIAIICSFLPQLIISFYSGAWADKYNRKKLVAYSDSLIAFVTLMLAILFLIGYQSIWILFIASALRSIGFGIHTPAVNSILPQIVPEEELVRINSLNATLQSIVALISPFIGGILLNSFKIEVIFLIDIFTALIAITILEIIVIPKHKEISDEKSSFKYLLQSIRYIKSDKFLKDFFIFFALITLLIGPVSSLTPLMITRTFGEKVMFLSESEIVFLIGSIIGGTILSIYKFNKRLKTIILASSMVGLLTILLGVSKYFIAYLGIMLLIGFFVSLIKAPSISLLEEETKDEMHGRIFGMIQVITTSITPLGILVFGPLSDIISVQALLIISGLLILFITTITINNKTIRKNLR